MGQEKPIFLTPFIICHFVKAILIRLIRNVFYMKLIFLQSMADTATQKAPIIVIVVFKRETVKRFLKKIRKITID